MWDITEWRPEWKGVDRRRSRHGRVYGSVAIGYFVASILCVLGVVACAGDPAPATTIATTTTTEPSMWEVYLDEEGLRLAAQDIVDRFSVQVEGLGVDLGVPPTVVVDTSAVLIYYNPSFKRIGVPFWEAVDAERKVVFSVFAGGDPEAGEVLFRASFNKFLVAHEAGHWLQHWGEMLEFRGNLFAGEAHANQVAVAFWMTQPGGEAFLEALEPMFQVAVDQLPDPTPPGEDPVEFFNRNYVELGPDPMRYGYYQFRMMLDAVQQRSTLTLDGLIPGDD